GPPLAPNTTLHAGSPHHHNTTPAAGPRSQTAQRPRGDSPDTGVPRWSAEAAAPPGPPPKGPPGGRPTPWGRGPTRRCHRIVPTTLVSWRVAKPLRRTDAP